MFGDVVVICRENGRYYIFYLFVLGGRQKPRVGGQ